ncbi:MAG: N-acetylglutamate synthase [Gaiellaceae bacterium]|jgi:GNAT superfamily N-acetyltransferase|nr:N-acetylglutamate synthase [Gaiellaceae bacterium]
MPSADRRGPGGAGTTAWIRALEDVGYAIWVSPEVEELDGWRLRHARGLTGRANSVFPNAPGALPLEQKIAHVEAWYAARAQPPRFQLTDASLPVGLAEALRGRGYEAAGSPVSVETSELSGGSADARVEVREELDHEWIELWTASRGTSELEAARALLTGSPGRTAYACIPGAAVGRAVAWGEWLGITSMVTLPDARRRGFARAIVESLIGWGRDAGATRGFLQTDSPVARALYAQFGWVEQYTYRYWWLCDRVAA